MELVNMCPIFDRVISKETNRKKLNQYFMALWAKGLPNSGKSTIYKKDRNGEIKRISDISSPFGWPISPYLLAPKFEIKGYVNEVVRINHPKIT